MCAEEPALIVPTVNAGFFVSSQKFGGLRRQPDSRSSITQGSHSETSACLSSQTQGMRTDRPNRLLGISPAFSIEYSFPTDIERNADASGIVQRPVFGSMQFVIFRDLTKEISDSLQPDTRTTEARKKTAEEISESSAR
jgi:hypothetical protein